MHLYPSPKAEKCSETMIVDGIFFFDYANRWLVQLL